MTLFCCWMQLYDYVTSPANCASHFATTRLHHKQESWVVWMGEKSWILHSKLLIFQNFISKTWKGKIRGAGAGEIGHQHVCHSPAVRKVKFLILTTFKIFWQFSDEFSINARCLNFKVPDAHSKNVSINQTTFKPALSPSKFSAKISITNPLQTSAQSALQTVPRWLFSQNESSSAWSASFQRESPSGFWRFRLSFASVRSALPRTLEARFRKADSQTDLHRMKIDPGWTAAHPWNISRHVKSDRWEWRLASCAES